MRDLWLKTLRDLRALEWIPQLVVRATVGFMFFGSGLNKLGGLEELVTYFESLGIPLASLQAPMAATIECVGGLALLFGVATRLVAVALSGIMVVAMATAIIPGLLDKGAGAFAFLLDFFYVSEWLLFGILAWLVFAGPGKVSVDWLLAQKYGAKS